MIVNGISVRLTCPRNVKSRVWLMPESSEHSPSTVHFSPGCGSPSVVGAQVFELIDQSVKNEEKKEETE